MTHHASKARCPWALLAVIAIPLALVLLGCSGGNDPSEGGGSQVTDSYDLVVFGALPVRGVQVDLSHGAAIIVTDAVAGSAFDGGACAENFETGRVRLGCAASTDVMPPLTAWTLEIRHASGTDPIPEIDALQCTATDASGATVAITCSLE